MAKREVNAAFGSLKELLSGDADFVREAVREYLQDVLEEEMTAALRAARENARWSVWAIVRAITSGLW